MLGLAGAKAMKYFVGGLALAAATNIFAYIMQLRLPGEQIRGLNAKHPNMLRSIIILGLIDVGIFGCGAWQMADAMGNLFK